MHAHPPPRARVCACARGQVREDHFIEGPSQHGAMSIHCQHVVQSFLRLHSKTRHIAAALVFGASRWTVEAVLKTTREALLDVMRALKAGVEVRMLTYALVRMNDETRYLTFTKAHHLTHFPPSGGGGGGGGGGPSDATVVQSWPPRTTQLFDSIFLSLDHIQASLDAENNTSGDLLQSWRSKKWRAVLTERARSAKRSGLLLPACKALLLHSAVADAAAAPGATPVQHVLPGVGRLLRSAASRLHSLSELNRTIQGVVASCLDEQHRLKADNKALYWPRSARTDQRESTIALLRSSPPPSSLAFLSAHLPLSSPLGLLLLPLTCRSVDSRHVDSGRMFHAYRVPTLEFVASDACNFETLRPTIQEGFSAVLTDLRQQGVLTRDARQVLETVDDYMRLAELALAQQVVMCDQRLLSALHDLCSR